MRPQVKLLALPQMQKCACDILHPAFDLCGGEA
ncbi:TPA: hypothetical protein ACWOXI_003592 [Salmonella enterica subsp. enterica]